MGRSFFFSSSVLSCSLALALGACSSGSGGGNSGGFGASAGSGTGGSAGSAGAGASSGAAGSAAAGGSSGTGGSAGTAGTGGGPPGSWSVIENDWLYGTKAIAGHPSQPSTVAILIEAGPAAPGQLKSVSVALSADSGKTLELTHVLDVPDPSYFEAHGFLFNPGDPAELAGAIGFPYGFPFEDLWQLIRSTNGAQSFSPTSMLQLDRLKWVAGNPGALVARAEGSIRRSVDFGQSFTPEPSPSACVGISDYTETSSHHLFACGDQGIQLCQGTSCQPATLPGGTGSIYAIERAPADPLRVIALAGGGASPSQVLVSNDGGQIFANAQALPAGNWRLHVDPRPTGTAIVAHDRAGHGVWRSADSGATFSDVTPSETLPNTRGLSTYAYELGVTADGGIVAYTAAGVLRFSP